MVGVGQGVIAAGPGTHGLKGSALSLPVEEVTRGNAVAVAIDLGPDNDKLVRIGVGHGGEKSGEDHAEDAGVGADPKNEGGKGYGGETRMLEDEPEAERNIPGNVC